MTVTKSWLKEEVLGHQKGFRFKIRFKGSQSHWSSQIFGLQSGSRKICSPTKLWSSQIRFKNVRFKKELASRKFEFKGHQKISGLESIWHLQNPGSMKKFRVIRKDSGLLFGSREVSLTEALKYPVYNPVQGKYILPQSSQTLKSGLKMSGSKRN